MTRVAVIGLDAMEWEVARRFADEGHLPKLSRLVEEGTFARLENVVAYRSELPWTLFLTGKPPENNKYWSTVEFDPASCEATIVGAHHAKPFYALGPERTVIAFDVPHSVPDEAVHGVQVLAWGAHSAQYPRASEPRGLLRQIDAEFGPHPGFDNDHDGAWYVPEYLEKLADACRNSRTGRPAVADVLRVSVDDPIDPHGPDSDLVVPWSEPLEALQHSTFALFGPIPFNRTGEHSSNGFVVVAGPGIEHADLGTRPALDVTPTILALLDVEPDPGFAGGPMVRTPSGVTDR